MDSAASSNSGQALLHPRKETSVPQLKCTRCWGNFERAKQIGFRKHAESKKGSHKSIADNQDFRSITKATINVQRDMIIEKLKQQQCASRETIVNNIESVNNVCGNRSNRERNEIIDKAKKVNDIITDRERVDKDRKNKKFGIRDFVDSVDVDMSYNIESPVNLTIKPNSKNPPATKQNLVANIEKYHLKNNGCVDMFHKLNLKSRKEELDFKYVFPKYVAREESVAQPQISSSELIKKTREVLDDQAAEKRKLNEENQKRKDKAREKNKRKGTTEGANENVKDEKSEKDIDQKKKSEQLSTGEIKGDKSEPKTKNIKSDIDLKGQSPLAKAEKEDQTKPSTNIPKQTTQDLGDDKAKQFDKSKQEGPELSGKENQKNKGIKGKTCSSGIVQVSTAKPIPKGKQHRSLDQNQAADKSKRHKKNQMKKSSVPNLTTSVGKKKKAHKIKIKSVSPLSPEMLLRKVLPVENCPVCTGSETEIIVKQKILKSRPENIGKAVKPIIYRNTYQNILESDQLTGVRPTTPTEVEVYEDGKAKNLLVDQEIGVMKYALSDRSFIEKGWTLLPTEKVVRKMNVYRMRPAHPEFDWFEHNKYKGLMQYGTGEKLAEFDEKGRGRWFYKNGNLALEYYDAEELNARQRFVVFSSGEPDERGRSRPPMNILATFDYNGNGIVFDHTGKIRLKYNQAEGVVLDKTLGPVTNWKWHSLNDPPILQQVMIDTQLPHKDPGIMSLGSKNEERPRPDNEDMLAIEFDNFIKEKSKKTIETKFKPFQIKVKALKINENFSLRVLDQTRVYLLFRDGKTNLKLNLGMILDHREIIDTGMAEVRQVMTSVEKMPALTDSIAALQACVAQAQRSERVHADHCRRLREPVAAASVDRMTASVSHAPLHPFAAGEPLPAPHLEDTATAMTKEPHRCQCTTITNLSDGEA